MEVANIFCINGHMFFIMKTHSRAHRQTHTHTVTSNIFYHGAYTTCAIDCDKKESL